MVGFCSASEQGLSCVTHHGFGLPAPVELPIGNSHLSALVHRTIFHLSAVNFLLPQNHCHAASNSNVVTSGLQCGTGWSCAGSPLAWTEGSAGQLHCRQTCADVSQDTGMVRPPHPTPSQKLLLSWHLGNYNVISLEMKSTVQGRTQRSMQIDEENKEQHVQTSPVRHQPEKPATSFSLCEYETACARPFHQASWIHLTTTWWLVCAMARGAGSCDVPTLSQLRS